MVAPTKLQGPLDEPFTFCIDRDLLRDIQVLSMSPGFGSQGDIARSLLCPIKREEIRAAAKKQPQYNDWRGRSRRLSN